MLRLCIRAALVGCLLTTLWPGTASASPPQAPSFGPGIESFSHYDGQTKCSPWAKPGVVAFQRMVLAAYPGTGAGNISRDCSVGGQSEHKEGRAWDWGVNVANASQKAAADSMLAWLAAPDEAGNRHAMARRVGLMYAIWNKRIFFPGSGWSTYCVQRRGACRDPQDGGTRHPHTDHVHFSFTWAGAKKKTTYWNPARTFVTAVAPSSTGAGFWAVTGNGSVLSGGSTPYLGAKDTEWLNKPIVAAASSPSGYGYYLVSRSGKIYAFGDARTRGPLDQKTTIVDIAVHPTGKGYWLLSAGGRIFSFGKVQSFAKVDEAGSPTALAATPTGLGLWALTSDGNVAARGDALYAGNSKSDAIDIVPSTTGLGYWIASAGGRVQAFGDAAVAGGFDGISRQPIVGMARTASSQGYWLVNRLGEATGFGDA